MLLPGKAGGTVAVRRTLACTICRIVDPTQVARPRQLRDASTVMRFRPAHQSMINRRFDDPASCLARKSPTQALACKPQIHSPASGNGGHESAGRERAIEVLQWREAVERLPSCVQLSLGIPAIRSIFVKTRCPGVAALPCRLFCKYAERRSNGGGRNAECRPSPSAASLTGAGQARSCDDGREKRTSSC